MRIVQSCFAKKFSETEALSSLIKLFDIKKAFS